MSARTPLGLPRTSGAPEGRRVCGVLLLSLGLTAAGCGGLTTHDGAGGDGTDESDGAGNVGADGESENDFDDPSEHPGDDDLGGNAGGADDVEACSCSANPPLLVLETPSGSYEFTEPPVVPLYPAFDFACSSPGPAYVPASCNRRASISACSSEYGCVVLIPGDNTDAQLTWYDVTGTSVTQVRSTESEAIIEQQGDSGVSGYFTFVQDGQASHWGKFSVCPVTVRSCE